MFEVYKKHMNGEILGLDSLTFIIIIVAIVAILALVIIFSLLEVFVFSRMRIRKSFNELNKKYKYLNSLLMIQDSQYLSRLEGISQTNLLYIDVYNEYLSRFNEIRDEKDANVADLLNALAVYVEDKNVKGYKKIYSENLAYWVRRRSGGSIFDFGQRLCLGELFVQRGRRRVERVHMFGLDEAEARNGHGVGLYEHLFLVPAHAEGGDVHLAVDVADDDAV